MNTAARADILRKKQMAHRQLEFLKLYQKNGGTIETITDPKRLWSIQEIIKTLTPMSVDGHKKVRIGGTRDGGYVMLPPEGCSIAYSLGVSPRAPWDIEIAQSGIKVFQYDASIEQEPNPHENILFHKYFISGLPQTGPYKTVEQLMEELGHVGRRDIILQMDIEGAEWEVFYHMKKETLLSFKQIIVELHDVGEYACTHLILDKLRETHTPIHFHYNNNVKQLSFLHHQNFIYSGRLMEITYARNDSFTFSPCHDYFPTDLDYKNTTKYPEDIPIGYFDLLPRDIWK